MSRAREESPASQKRTHRTMWIGLYKLWSWWTSAASRSPTCVSGCVLSRARSMSKGREKRLLELKLEVWTTSIATMPMVCTKSVDDNSIKAHLGLNTPGTSTSVIMIAQSNSFCQMVCHVWSCATSYKDIHTCSCCTIADIDGDVEQIPIEGWQGGSGRGYRRCEAEGKKQHQNSHR